MGRTSLFTLGAILVLAIVLLTAAYGKLFYPTDLLGRLDFWVGVFEVALLVLLILFQKRWVAWVLTAQIFALWLGYSLFWYTLELPCSCMGKLVELPTGFSLLFDLFFFSTSLSIGHLLGAKRDVVFLSVLVGCLCGLFGFAFGQWIYKTTF